MCIKPFPHIDWESRGCFGDVTYLKESEIIMRIVSRISDMSCQIGLQIAFLRLRTADLPEISVSIFSITILYRY